MDGTSAITGAISNQTGGILNLNTGITLGGGLLTNAGTMNIFNNSTFTNAVTNSATGTMDITGNTTFSSELISTGTIDMTDDSTTGVVTINGNANLDETNFILDIDMSGATNQTDNITVNGIATGDVTLTFNNTATPTLGATTPMEVLTFGAGSTATAAASNLPSGGSVLFSLTKTGDSWFLQGGLNPAFAGVSSGVALTQSLISSVVNRPSSPFVSGLAVQDDDPCGPGAWARITGGGAEVDGTFRTDGLGSFSGQNISADFKGIQGGGDFSCFNGYYNGWDMSFGAIAGLNMGSTVQPVYFFNPGTGQFDLNTITSYNNTEFTQGYAGAYVTLARDGFAADLQLRYDNTSFDIANTLGEAGPLGLIDQTFASSAYTLSGSVSKVFNMSEEAGIILVPTAGFSVSQISTGSVNFTGSGNSDPGILTIHDSQVLVGFIGATLARTQVLPDQRSALTYFATGTVYNDFAGESRSTFTPTSGSPADAWASNLGTYGEVSLGVNYTRILQDSDFSAARQFNASVRLDGRLSDKLQSWGVTAQVRIQF